MHMNAYYISSVSHQKLQYKEYSIERANTWKNTARLTELLVTMETEYAGFYCIIVFECSSVNKLAPHACKVVLACLTVPVMTTIHCQHLYNMNCI